MSNNVVVCTWGGEKAICSSGVEEALTLGRTLSATLGSELRLLVLGDAPANIAEFAGNFGAAGVDVVGGEAYASFQGDVIVTTIARYLEAHPAKALMINQTFDARAVLPRIGGRMGAGVVMNAVDLSAEGDTINVTTSAFGGDTRTVYAVSATGTAVIGVNDNACIPEPSGGGAASVDTIAIDVSDVTERVRVTQSPEAHGPKLEDAQVIVAGGRGLQEAENFRLVDELAVALGGVSAASRPIVDDGWADPSQQVGLTGKITKPNLYVACGISGASQHMVGCSAAKNLVAINTDPDAAIFKHARFGLVGDCLEILPELTKAVKG